MFVFSYILVIFIISLLVVKNYIRKPNSLAGHIQGLHAAIFNRVPFQLVVVPRLKGKERKVQGENIFTEQKVRVNRTLNNRIE